MKKVIIALSLVFTQIAQADVVYPNQNDIPTLTCEYNGAAFTLDAPTMIWEKEANTKWPEYNGFTGKSEIVTSSRLHPKIKFTVTYTDNAAYGRNIQLTANLDDDYLWNSTTYEVASFSDIKKIQLMVTSADYMKVGVYRLECKRAK